MINLPVERTTKETIESLAKVKVEEGRTLEYKQNGLSPRITYQIVAVEGFSNGPVFIICV